MKRIAHLAFRCPLRCRLGRKTTVFAGKILIGNSLASNGANDFRESPCIVIVAIVKSKTLLIHVTEQMERLDADISSANRSLQKTPEVFNSVRVDMPINISF